MWQRGLALHLITSLASECESTQTEHVDGWWLWKCQVTDPYCWGSKRVVVMSEPECWSEEGINVFCLFYCCVTRAFKNEIKKFCDHWFAVLGQSCFRICTDAKWETLAGVATKTVPSDPRTRGHNTGRADTQANLYCDRDQLIDATYEVKVLINWSHKVFVNQFTGTNLSQPDTLPGSWHHHGQTLRCRLWPDAPTLVRPAVNPGMLQIPQY